MRICKLGILMIALYFTALTPVQGQTLLLDNAIPIKSTASGTNNDTGNSVSYDHQGNYYIAVVLNGRVDFDPTTAGIQGPASILNNGQAFLAKYSASGAFQWFKPLSGVTGSYLPQVATSSDGVFVSHLSDDGANYKVVLSKYDFNGAALWSNTLNMSSTANRVNSVKTDAGGNVYISGTFAGSGVDFDPGAGSAPLSSTGGSSPSGYVAKYNASGTYQWAFAVAGNTASDASNYGSGMSNFKMAISGNSLFVTGRFVGSNIDFDPSPGINTLSMNGSTLGPIFIAKYDLSQQPSSSSFFQWVFQPQGAFASLSASYSARFSMPSDIDADAQGNIYTVGQYVLAGAGATADFDPGSGATPAMSTGTTMKLYVASYNGTITPTANGFYRWAFSRDGSSSNATTATAPNYSAAYIGALSCDDCGNIYLGGSFRGANVNMNPLGTPMLLSGSNADIYIAKYSTNGICLSANSFAAGSDGLSNGISSLRAGNGKLYATGTFKSSTGIDFDPGTGATAITSFSTGTDPLVLKYSPILEKPILVSLTQPTCTLTKGTFRISNYDASNTYAVAPSSGVSVSADIVTAPAGTYTVTVSSLVCPSILPSTSDVLTVNPLASNIWNGTAWSSGSVPDDSQKIIFAGDFSSSGDLSACACQVDSGTVVINHGHTLKVSNEVIVSGGSLTFEDQASLVQINDNQNTGTIKVRRDTKPMYRYDFTYWSSPVDGQTLHSLSPGTLFDKFFKWGHDAAVQNWQSIPYGTETMVGGRGYIIRAPQNYQIEGNPGATAQVYNAEFTGVPFNGTVHHPVTGGVQKWSLLGNPYPSAISADAFLDANSTHPGNMTNDILGGTLYFWTHNTAIVPAGNGIYQYNAGDYASYNSTGGTATTAGEGVVNDTEPTGHIASGQSFFVKAMVSGNAVFNNVMRISGNNGQFFRPSPTEPANNWYSIGKHRIWLNLKGIQKGFSQLLVGYVENATNGLDTRFDGESFGGNQVTFYSLLQEQKLSIQGRALPFSQLDEVTLGYRSTLSDTLSISIDHYDGLFEGQDIFLEDLLLDVVHDLKESDYLFHTFPGTYNDRFVLRYVPAAVLGADENIAGADDLMVFKDDGTIVIKSPFDTFEHVTVHDLLGRRLFELQDGSQSELNINEVAMRQQPLLVTVKLTGGQSVTKKIIY